MIRSCIVLDALQSKDKEIRRWALIMWYSIMLEMNGLSINNMLRNK